MPQELNLISTMYHLKKGWMDRDGKSTEQRHAWNACIRSVDQVGRISMIPQLPTL